ncbi:MAG TPA: ABC transporter permease [Steroidobacteraceae bacterium]|nr:ABC transporter permease [Steroidobacteraceae bacterium]
MLAYHIRLGLKSLRRNPVLTALMIGAIAIGIAVCLTALNVFTLVSSNPLAHRNDVVYAVQMDNWDPKEPWWDDHPELAPFELTYRDAKAVLASDIPDRTVIMRKTAMIMAPPDGVTAETAKPFVSVVRMTPPDFFPMFDVPFKYGGPWDDKAEAAADAVIVLSKENNEKFFGGEDSVGRMVKLDDREYRVVGVLDDYYPVPKFFDVNNGALDDPEDGYVPFERGQMFELQSAGNTNCWKPESLNSFRDFLNSECVWIQAWVELRTPAKVAEFKAFLDGYVTEQKKFGRFERPLKTKLSKVSEWLEMNEVVEDDNRVLLGIACMFLAVCLLNTVGLLLAKFSGAAAVVSLHRALGASRAMIFRQHIVEVALIGVTGGVIGIGLGWLLLLALRQLYNSYEAVTHLDWSVGLIALALSLVAGVLAGLYPTWRICRLQPAPYLKTQ